MGGKKADLTSSRFLPILRRYGIEVMYKPSLVYFASHFKIFASESEAIIGGQNLIDQAVTMDDKTMVWHDTSVLIHGSLVNDINRIFIEHFNKYLTINHVWRFADVVGRFLGLYKNAKLNRIDISRTDYFSKSNDEYPGSSSGRIVTSLAPSLVNPAIDKYSGPLLFEAAMGMARNFIFIENPYISDRWAVGILVKKARQMGLRDLKLKNGESLSKSTCDYNKIRSRGKGILIVAPHRSDVGLSKVAYVGALNALINSGVDVCQWYGKLYNDAHPDPDDKGYDDNALSHSKVWVVDDKMAYVGSANLNVRSRWGDLEIGLVTSDPKIISDINQRLFEVDTQYTYQTKTRFLNHLVKPLNWLGNLLRVF
jgi:phosphatidylserine/phosphatidylglycerophosphate/cardiolipin synthase-like enzyme